MIALSYTIAEQHFSVSEKDNKSHPKKKFEKFRIYVLGKNKLRIGSFII